MLIVSKYIVLCVQYPPARGTFRTRENGTTFLWELRVQSVPITLLKRGGVGEGKKVVERPIINGFPLPPLLQKSPPLISLTNLTTSLSLSLSLSLLISN